MKKFFESITVCHLDRSKAERIDLSSTKLNLLGKGVVYSEISHPKNYYFKQYRIGCGFEMTSCHLDRSEAEWRDPLTTSDKLNLNDTKIIEI